MSYYVGVMAKPDALGQFEQLVLTATLSLRDNAYGVTIHEKVLELAHPKAVSPGAVYITLDRLEDKGMLSSWLTDPTPERGGRAKRCYRLEALGERALQESAETAKRIWETVAEVLGAREAAQVESGPSEVIVRLVGRLIPPASREEVSGDMRERCGSTYEFLGEASHVVPYVIVSRVRRTSDPLLLLMEGVMAFTAFFTAAWWLERRILYSDWGLIWLAIPVAVVLLTMMIADAYSDPKRRWAMRPLVGPLLGMGLALGVDAALGQWALPRAVMAWGGGMGMLLVSTMRMMFPPAADQLQAAKIPAFWLKLEAVSLNLRRPAAIYVLLAAAAIACYAVSRIWR